ncbi:ABC transporter substrate-binding protein [Kutzneria albida]|uniref:Extracellular solute-binding protein family 1 n=1 Tax=Kutzneria albida DSM 43870 TaxID=1449976 RepID=W5W7Z5_9PSEU|nr:ABC transporter substrate-binding protein [Kutzneria albida]AHH94344.1 extracellular solute-binding protein family 1 [Kutzneria albida DSM 43870]
MDGPGRGRQSRYRVTAALATAVVAAPALAACGASTAGGITINVYYAPEQHFQQVVDDCNKQADGKYTIVYTKAPRDSDGEREQKVRRLAAKDPSIDVVGLDVTWTPEFASAGWIEPWTGENKAEAEKDVLAGPLASARYDGQLYAATKNTNVELLWYRADLVSQPPSTWDEMISQAQQLKSQGKPYQVAFKGAQYEGLVVAFNTLTASSGGTIVSPDGSKATVDEGAVQALGTLKKFATSGVTSANMSNAHEQEAALQMENGDAAFEINWPYVYASMQQDKPDLAKNFKWARYPSAVAGQPSKVTIGGYNLAVSSFSPHKAEAFSAALCLRSAKSQEYSAVNDGVPPTISSAYDSAEMAKAYPMKDTIKDELETAVTRPVTPAYQNASIAIQNAISPPASIQPQQTADAMRKSIQEALDSKGVLP